MGIAVESAPEIKGINLRAAKPRPSLLYSPSLSHLLGK